MAPRTTIENHRHAVVSTSIDTVAIVCRAANAEKCGKTPKTTSAHFRFMSLISVKIARAPRGDRGGGGGIGEPSLPRPSAHTTHAHARGIRAQSPFAAIKRPNPIATRSANRPRTPRKSRGDQRQKTQHRQRLRQAARQRGRRRKSPATNGWRGGQPAKLGRAGSEGWRGHGGCLGWPQPGSQSRKVLGQPCRPADCHPFGGGNAGSGDGGGPGAAMAGHRPGDDRQRARVLARRDAGEGSTAPMVPASQRHRRRCQREREEGRRKPRRSAGKPFGRGRNRPRSAREWHNGTGRSGRTAVSGGFEGEAHQLVDLMRVKAGRFA